MTANDLATYEARWRDPLEVGYAGTRVVTRGGLAACRNCSPPASAARRERTDRVLALLPVLEQVGRDAHDQRVGGRLQGERMRFTTSLGLGSGDWLPGLDMHLNSMLGEVDLSSASSAGERMSSMMAPSLAFDSDGLALAIGSAGGTRLRTALTLVLAGILDEGLTPQAAMERPRFHTTGDVVNAEAGVDEDALASLEAAGPPRPALARPAPLLRRRERVGAPERRAIRAAAARPSRSDRAPRSLDIGRDRLDQLRFARERALVAQPLPELDHETRP